MNKTKDPGGSALDYADDREEIREFCAAAATRPIVGNRSAVFLTTLPIGLPFPQHVEQNSTQCPGDIKHGLRLKK
jgi:hypothetical protein